MDHSYPEDPFDTKDAESSWLMDPSAEASRR